MNIEVPSPIDLRLMPDALEWEQTATSKRPWRAEFFFRFAAEIKNILPAARNVLELGSGPGFLAEYLLNALDDIQYVLFDFSPAMHQLAKARLGSLADRAEFVERSFKLPDWTEGLRQFDCVTTNQAVHELRHKSYATQLHSQVHKVLKTGGLYLVCDHYIGEGGMKNDQLYMTVEEQRVALLSAGFSTIEQVLLKGGLVLHRAER